MEEKEMMNHMTEEQKAVQKAIWEASEEYNG